MSNEDKMWKEIIFSRWTLVFSEEKNKGQVEIAAVAKAPPK